MSAVNASAVAVSDCTHSDSEPIRMARHERKVKDTIIRISYICVCVCVCVCDDDTRV